MLMAAPAFEGWAIVELMGHRKLAGHCSEITIAGAAMLRLDVPSDPPVTQFYGGAAIYCITPTTETLARRVASASRPTPVSRYELPERSAGQPGGMCDAGDTLPDSDDDEAHDEDVAF